MMLGIKKIIAREWLIICGVGILAVMLYSAKQMLRYDPAIEISYLYYFKGSPTIEVKTAGILDQRAIFKIANDLRAQDDKLAELEKTAMYTKGPPRFKVILFPIARILFVVSLALYPICAIIRSIMWAIRAVRET